MASWLRPFPINFCVPISSAKKDSSHGLGLGLGLGLSLPNPTCFDPGNALPEPNTPL